MHLKSRHRKRLGLDDRFTKDREIISLMRLLLTL